MRRIFIALGILLIGTSLVWFLWLPHHRPDLLERERYGIDVAHHQGTVDWQRVAGDGISFAYIKATEGADHVDPKFEANLRGAREAGLDRGAYHFFTLCTSGAAQATHLLRTLAGRALELPPAVDLELAGNCAARPHRRVIEREVERFLELVESALGTKVILYVGDDFESLYPTRDRMGRDLWQLSFLRRPDVEGWVVWQVMGFAHVNGIHGDVDLNVASASLSADG